MAEEQSERIIAQAENDASALRRSTRDDRDGLLKDARDEAERLVTEARRRADRTREESEAQAAATLGKAADDRDVMTQDAVREAAAQYFSRYGQLPSYRAILDREGVKGPEEVALIGNEAAVGAGIAALADAGATHFSAALFTPPGEDAGRTLAFLATAAHNARA